MSVNIIELVIASKYLWAAGIVWPPIIVAIVVARFSTRYAQRMKPGIDDWLTLPALILVTGVGVNLLVGVATGTLVYPTTTPAQDAASTSKPDEQIVLRKLYWISMIFDIPALTLLKLSCMLFYARIFQLGSSRVVGTTFHIINAFIVLWGLGFWLAFLFPCKTHWEWLWSDLANISKCPADMLMMHESLFVSNVVMDLIIFIVPIPLVAKLRISIAKKIAVLCVFFLGAMTIAMSIVRLALTYQQSNHKYNPSGLYFMYNEACFALCAVCLPTLAGALRLRRVQAIRARFASVFSKICCMPFQSGDNAALAKKSERLESAHGDALGLVPGKSSGSVNRAEAMNDVELACVDNDTSIVVTYTLDQQSLKV